MRRPWPLAQPGYVLRQLWMQAAELGEDRLASDLRARLRSQPHSDLIPVWTTRRTSRALAAELGQHHGTVLAVAVLPDGRVVTSGNDRRLLVWDPSLPGTDPVELGRHDSFVKAMAASPDGRVVTSSSGRVGGRLLVWDPSQPGTDPVEFGRYDGSVFAVAVLPDGRVVSTSGERDGRVLLWDPSELGTGPVERGHDGPVKAVAVLPDGRVISGGFDRRVLIWNASTQRQVAQLGCSVIGLTAVQASRGEASLVVLHEGQGFSFWSTTKDTTMSQCW